MTVRAFLGIVAYWIDGQGCSWLGPVECAPWRYGTPNNGPVPGFIAQIIGAEGAVVPVAPLRETIARSVTAFRVEQERRHLATTDRGSRRAPTDGPRAQPVGNTDLPRQANT
jgi:hypothetical protein